jgi:hypothetical protein
MEWLLDAAPWILLGFLLVMLLLWVGYTIGADYFGFGRYTIKETETVEYTGKYAKKRDPEEDAVPSTRQITKETQTRKTLWDWLTVVLISGVIAFGGLLYTIHQAKQQRDLQNQQENESALQAYLDQMGRLMLDEDTPLPESKKDNAVQTLARMRTVTTLKMLDAEQNESITTFLKESGLVDFQRPGAEAETVLRLDHADLKGVDLKNSDVSGFDLRYTNLRGAKLGNARLDIAKLSFADLYGADLTGAVLRDTDLVFANLNDADLRGANLSGADLRGANLEKAKNLTVEQINKAAAVNAATKLPPDVRKGSRWSNTSATVGQPLTDPTLGASLVAREDLKPLVDKIGIPKEVPSTAVLIYDVQPNSPAQEAGIQSGDFITSVDGHDVQGPEDMREKVDKAGRYVWFNTWRRYFQGWGEGTLDIHWLENN